MYLMFVSNMSRLSGFACYGRSIYFLLRMKLCRAAASNKLIYVLQSAAVRLEAAHAHSNWLHRGTYDIELI
jgi:hypothetical protein